MKILTIDDLPLEGKTVFLRVDMNTPVDPKSGRLMELSRIAETSETIRDLKMAKVVVASHQGRVGGYDYISMEQHAEALRGMVDQKIKFIEDIFGPTARSEIRNLRVGEVLLLDNLRFAAEENAEFSPEDAAKTVFVKRLQSYFDACVLDAFATAHRAHPSIVGFAHLLPACGGRIVQKEVEGFNRVLSAARRPFVSVLGGAKVSDRLDSLEKLIRGGRADKVLLGGLIGNVFLRASGRIKFPLKIGGEDEYVEKASHLLKEYSETFILPVDVAVDRDGERVEKLVGDLQENDKIGDLGSITIDQYSKIVGGSGMVFLSGPAGMFEKEGFKIGTEALIKAAVSSKAATIVGGGHLSAALQMMGLKDRVSHVSTAGGALVRFLVGGKLPLIEALEAAAARAQRKTSV